MSNRFHNKFHRQNHHSKSTPNFPDSSYDPIASYAAPFQGEFYSQGDILTTENLSAVKDIFATNGTLYNNLSVGYDALVKNDLTVENNAFVDDNLTVGNDVQIDNNLNVSNNATIQNNLTVVGNISAVGNIAAQSSTVPVTVTDITNNKTFSNVDTNKVFHFSNSSPLTAIFPSTLSDGFNVALMNTGTSTLHLSTNSTYKAVSNVLTDQYAGAYVYKANSEIFAVGRF